MSELEKPAPRNEGYLTVREQIERNARQNAEKACEGLDKVSAEQLISARVRIKTPADFAGVCSRLSEHPGQTFLDFEESDATLDPDQELLNLSSSPLEAVRAARRCGKLNALEFLEEYAGMIGSKHRAVITGLIIGAKKELLK